MPMTLPPELMALLLTYTPSRLYFILMGFDLAFGYLRAAKQRQINSTIGRDGWIVKAGICLLIALGWLMEPFAKGVPLADAIALGFCVVELTSIFENAALIGIPIPQVIKDLFEKVVQGSKANGSGV